MELHTVSWLEQGGSASPEALPDEVWGGAMGPDPGDSIAARQAHSAAEWPDAAPPWPAVPCRYLLADSTVCRQAWEGLSSWLGHTLLKYPAPCPCQALGPSFIFGLDLSMRLQLPLHTSKGQWTTGRYMAFMPCWTLLNSHPFGQNCIEVAASAQACIADA